MQLVKLIVLKNKETIREIKFNKGINFVTCAKEDGNQIGKSTTLRVLNFCLGSEGESIWKDPETKQINEEIKELVTGGLVEFILKIKSKGITHTIVREIEKFGKKKIRLRRISKIDDSEFKTNESFREELAKLVGLPYKSPSFSQIKNRLVRINKSTVSNAFNYDDKFTSAKDYTFLYSYIFEFNGLSNLEKEIELSKEVKKRQDRVLFLLNDRSEQFYKDKIASINLDIENLKNQENTFDFKDSQNKNLRNLKESRELISQVSSEISDIEIKIYYTNKTINSYMANISKANTSEIEKIYEEAKLILPEIKKSLDETIEFHNDSIRKKTSYLEKKLLEYNINLKYYQKNLNMFLELEKSIIKELSNESGLAGFFMIEKELQEKHEERGRFGIIVDEVRDENKEITNINKNIIELRGKNEENIEKLKENIKIFNKIFRKITKKVFKGIELKLNVEINSATNELNYSIINFDKISGDGSPRAASLAFDMALIEYYKERKLERPEFTIQDYLEAIDEDKLAILSTYANEQNIQVVASVLKHTLQSLNEDFIQENTVLWLSKSNKFFKLP